ncbi:uncharacterized protein LOC100185482 [Ciona intestinalis]
MDQYRDGRYRQPGVADRTPPMPNTLSVRSSMPTYSQGGSRQSWNSSNQFDSSNYGEGYYPNQQSAKPDSQWQEQPKPARPVVPPEVKELMKSLNLSPSDLQKLSQLPDNQLSVDNLARAIGNLKQQKGNPHKEQQQQPAASSMRSRQPQTSYNRDSSYNSQSILGAAPGGYSGRYSDSSPNPTLRNKVGGIKVTVKSVAPSPKRDQQMNYGDRSYRKADTYYPDQSYNSSAPHSGGYDESGSYMRSRGGQQQTRQYEEEEQYGRPRMEQPHSSPHGGPQGRGLLKRPDSSYVSDSPARKQSRWEKPKSSGLLGNPMQPNSLGLETLAASVGHNTSPYNVTQAALLNPLVLAQRDPSVLEAQLKAIEALQAGSVAMNRQEPSFEHRDRDNDMDNNNRGRRQGGDIISHVIKEVNEMRKMQGRVLYLRYKSNRIMESDLRQLAEAFGKVTNLLTIRAKIPNGYHQAFMEMDHWDCAAAMLERYMTKSPLIKGCVVMVQKSNYKDLKLRYAQNRGQTKRNRSLSVSPVRKGTTQLGDKRGRDERGRDAREDRPAREARSARDTREDRGRKSLENSRSNNSAEKRVAPKSEEKRRSERERDSGRRRTPDKDRRRRESRRSNERKRTNDRKPNEATSDANKSSDSKKSSEQKKSSDAGKSSEKIVEKEEKEESKMRGEKEEEKQDGEAGKVKDEIDPLDTIADELALHDEFVLMDEVGYEPSKKKIEKSDLSDLEGGVLDLENLNVDVTEDKVDPEVAEDQGSQDAGTEAEEDQKDESTDDKEDVTQVRVCADKENEKDENEERDQVNDKEEKEEVNDEDGAGEDGKVQEQLEDTEQKKEEELDSGDKVDEQEKEIQETGMIDAGEEEAGKDQKEDLPVVGVTPSREGSPTEDLKDVDVGKMDEGSQENKEDDVLVDGVTENLKEIKGMETNLSTADQDTENLTDNHIMSHDMAHDADNHMNETSQSYESDDKKENHENNDDVTKLKEAISITLTYVESAQEHLTALTKVTKNKAAQAVAKKLRLCLEEAASSLTCVSDDVKLEE